MMQFDRLRDMTALPADRLETAFQHEDVIAVLPVSEPGSGEATVLVATPRKLGIATLRRLAGRGRWITRWAPWDAVRFDSGPKRANGPATQSEAPVTVGGKEFRAVLGGSTGTVALRDFGRSARRRRRALVGRELAQSTLSTTGPGHSLRSSRSRVAGQDHIQHPGPESITGSLRRGPFTSRKDGPVPAGPDGVVHPR